MKHRLVTFLSELGLGRLARRCFFNDESGQDLIEYALVAALVGLGAVSAMSSLASNIGTALNGVGSTLASSI